LLQPDLNAVAAQVLRRMPHASVIVFTDDLRIGLVGGRGLARDGLSEVECEGRHVSEALTPERWEVCEPLFRAALEGRSSSIEVELETDGEIRWYLLDVEPLGDAAGQIAGGACFCREITDRKRLQDELEQRARLLDLAHDAIIVREPTRSAVTYWNREAQRIYGYSPDEARGRITHELLATTFPDSQEAVDAELLARGRWEGELVHVCKDGRRILVSSRQALVLGEHGEPVAVIELNSDTKQLLRRLEQALAPRMHVDHRWQLAWRSQPSVTTMLLGGDFIGVCERRDGSLSLLIGDVTGHGPAAAGTGAMLRAAWLGAVQADVAIGSVPEVLQRLLINHADRDATTLATVCLAQVDPMAQELQLIRAGHDSPLLITDSAVTALDRDPGPALGLPGPSNWPLHRVPLPTHAAIMLFTDGLTERRTSDGSGRVGFDELLARLDAHAMLTQPPEQAIDEMLARVFPNGTEHLEDDLAVILLTLGTAAATARAADARA